MSSPWSNDSPAPSTGAAPAARDRTSNPLLMNGIEQYRKFEKALEKARGKSLLVLLSGHPDPDAIGSALAHRLICEKMDIATTIAHVLPVSRPENRALVKLLNLNMRQVSDAAELRDYDFLSLVDTSTSESTIDL